MSHRKFGPNDIFINRVKMHPEWDFFIYSGSVYINKQPNVSGSFTENYKGVPPGYLSLYEYNLDRASSDIGIHPFLSKSANYKTRFRSDLLNLLGEPKPGSLPFSTFGDTIEAEYKMSASITRQRLDLALHTVDGPFGQEVIPRHNNTASVLQNMCIQYQKINNNFSNTLVSSLTASGKTPLDTLFDVPHVNMINIPSIFYGSEIKKGTVELNYYITGTVVSTVKDLNENGQLICTHDLMPAGSKVSGSVVGHVLYREGLLFFTGDAVTPDSDYPASQKLSNDDYSVTYNGDVSEPKWLHFGHGANEKSSLGVEGVALHNSHTASSYSINFEGTTYKNVMTLFCHADKGELNYSNNPTFLNTKHSASIVTFHTGAYTYNDNEIELKNVASSSFHKGEDEFRKVTYASKVGIYDENNNLLMTVDLARPYKKEEKDNFTFKIKYDLL